MNGMRYRRQWQTVATAGVVLAIALVGSNAWSDDLITLSGTVYHDVRPLNVEPDGVTWQFSEGVCKVDFADCSERVRQMYRYDASKAAAYRASELQSRQQADDRKRQILQENDARRVMKMQAAIAANAAHAAAGADIIFRRAASPAASEATHALGEQLATTLAKQTAGTASIDAFTKTKVGSAVSSLGLLHYTHPAEVLNPDEFKTDLHHAPGGFSPDAAHDDFYQPLYLSKSYQDDIDRSSAFAAGLPIRP